MKTVAEQIIRVAHELQALNSLSNSFLAGGTNLALRLNHRRSVDLDLFFADQLGQTGFKAIEEEVRRAFHKKITVFQYPCQLDDEFIFARTFIIRDGVTIKIEILQNMHITDEIEVIHGLRMASVSDIGLFKLVSAAQRNDNKDVYDLDHITDHLPLSELMERLSQKVKRVQGLQKRTIFDLDGSNTPLDDPLVLLNFESPKAYAGRTKPFHSSSYLEIVDGKEWAVSRHSWRAKVREYIRLLGIDFPKHLGIDTE